MIKLHKFLHTFFFLPIIVTVSKEKRIIHFLDERQRNEFLFLKNY